MHKVSSHEKSLPSALETRGGNDHWKCFIGSERYLSLVCFSPAFPFLEVNICRSGSVFHGEKSSKFGALAGDLKFFPKGTTWMSQEVRINS